jgi:hypothetical protein
MTVRELSDILPQLHPDFDIPVDDSLLQGIVSERVKRIRLFVAALSKRHRINAWDREWLIGSLIARKHVANFVVHAKGRVVGTISGMRLTAALQQQYLDLFADGAKPPQEKKR